MGDCEADAEQVDTLSTIINDEIDDELRALVKPELEVGERMLWAARAHPHRSSIFVDLRSRLVWVATFGIASIAGLTDFFGLLLRSESYHPDGWFRAIGFLSGIIAFIIVLFCVTYWLSKRTEFKKMANQSYALTDRRAIIWRREPKTGGVEVFQFTADKIRDIHRVEFPDGRGDVVFRLSPTSSIHWDRPWEHSKAFQGIANVRVVEGMARRVLLRRRSGKAGRRFRKPE